MNSIIAQQLVVPEPFTIGYEEVPLLTPGPGQVRVRTRLSGISHGTEMAAYLGTSPFRERKFTDDRIFAPLDANDPPFYPYRFMGYDAVGIVENVGEGVTCYVPGDRVWAAAVHQTHFHIEDDFEDAFVLPEEIPDEDAIMLHLATVAFTAVQDAEIALRDTVAVVGGGAVGQLVVQCALLNGAGRVFLIEPSSDRRQFAEEHSVVVALDPAAEVPVRQIRERNDGEAPDVVFECSGAAAGLHTAIQTAGVAGMVVSAGFLTGPATALALGEEFHHNRVTIKSSMGVWNCPPRRGSLWTRRRVLSQVLALMESRKLNLSGFLMAKFPFTEGQRAYDAIRSDPGQYLKVAFCYEA